MRFLFVGGAPNTEMYRIIIQSNCLNVTAGKAYQTLFNSEFSEESRDALLPKVGPFKFNVL